MKRLYEYGKTMDVTIEHVGKDVRLKYNRLPHPFTRYWFHCLLPFELDDELPFNYDNAYKR